LSQKSIKGERYYKSWAKAVLAFLTVVLLFLGFRASQLQFDYDFEKFFPQDDQDLAFFKEYRDRFENDNDFIILAFRNSNGIFDPSFLKKLSEFDDSLQTLPHLREIISPLDLNYFEFKAGAFAPLEKSFFHPDKPSLYHTDSLRIATTTQPIANMVNLENQSLIILVKNVQLISKQKSDELAISMRNMLERQDFEEYHVMGKIIGQLEYIEVMKKEFLTFMIISVFVLILFLVITYRSFWGVLIPLATVLLAVVASLGFMQLSGKPLNMMTTLLPVIMLVVGMSDVVHLVSKYLEEIRKGQSQLAAIQLMLKKVGVATLLTSLTTALGFVTLIGVSMEPIRDFGIFTALGVLIAFVLSILFIPSIFLLIGKPKIANAKKLQDQWESILGGIFIWLCRKRKKVLIAYLLLTVIAIVGASRIKFDYFLMQDLDEGQDLMAELSFFQKHYGGIRPFELAVIPQGNYQVDDYKFLKEVVKLEAYLTETYGVNQLFSPSLPYKYLNQALRNGKEEYFVLTDNENRFEYLKKQLQRVKDREEWRALVADDGKMGRLYGRMVDPGSREMLKRNEDLERFYQSEIDSSILAYQLTGTPVIIDRSGRYVTQNVIFGLLIAFGLIGLSMGFLFKSIKMAFLSLVPNLFPILITAGYIGFAGIALNMSTAIVFTIAFGIAVDDTIHFLSRYKQEMVNGRSRLFGLRRTFLSTGKAIIITTLILLGGFGSLLFSDFLSTFYIGLFVCMTLVFAVVTDLTLLPLLLLGNKKNRSKTFV